MQKVSKLSEQILKYLVAAILIAVPLYPKFPFIRIPGTFVSIRLEDTLLLVGLLVFLIFIYSTGDYKEILKNRLSKAFALYLIAGLISTLASIYITHTTESHIVFLHWIRRIEYFTPFFMGYYLVKKDRSILNYYFKLVLLVIVVAFIYGLGQRYLSWPIIITQNEEYSKGVALRWLSGSHINSTFAGHYDLASYLILVLPAVVVYFFYEKSVKTKAVLLLSYFGGMWLMVNSASRISLVSYLVAVTLALVLAKKIKQIPLVIIISIAFVGFSSNLLARYTRIIDVTLDKISQTAVTTVNAQELPNKRITITPTPATTMVLEDRSTNIRINVEWPRAIRAFLKNPLLGTGYSSITLATDNDYLRALGETGLLGFITMAYIFLLLALNYISMIPLQRNISGLEIAFTAGIIGSVVGIFINAVFIDVFEASKFAINYWAMLGLSQGLIIKKYE
ncbi:MAG: hypothetical protein US62_C0002G0009 [Candidatus Woesebacteria bacterium GW2011_GWA1_37_8]|uniref:O-antigen ligase-related domain-containing protein n=2 Tax=Candidatus Woeseibacteriota TaxID=1752722 RepID=A0A0G0NNJ7_9BACT|nr:MAG: hypothetical protein US39_C0009G0007 [Microgenomates group bacterium GW2011_GWC1_37_12b]KKQ46326.1 MAG: hypothetical protein US62_C0002G0009 [Candidatus Woesebacteria bacterium GW2011_GWA1_37_8]KKQ87484.1 MAG: hypothetical protein UT10_C0005G0007 [Candidatus Woesebacteria bacterium GW2011_GWB1_38_8b]